jgi:putative membrane protein
MKQPFARAALAAAALMASSGAFADHGALSHADSKFLEKAAVGGRAEVELGKLAQQKAMREEVKEFATRMVEDHSKANAELEKIAAANNVQLPADVDRKTRKEMDKLGKLMGGDFDREYMKNMVKDHRDDVEEFRKQAKSRQEGEAKAFAQRTLPTLEEHLAMAEKTYDITDAIKRTGNREVGSTH